MLEIIIIHVKVNSKLCAPIVGLILVLRRVARAYKLARCGEITSREFRLFVLVHFGLKKGVAGSEA